MFGRFPVRLAAAVLAAALAGCSGGRIGEPSVDHSLVQGQITGPAPAFMITARRDGDGRATDFLGTVTALEDGTLVTAAHVLRGSFSWQINGRDIRSLDIVRSGGGGDRDEAYGFVGDWIQFRAEPFEHPGWPVSERRPEVGEIMIIRGFTRPLDATGRPLLREIRARLCEAPWWIDDSGRHLLYAEPADNASNIAFAGVSGGPVVLKDATTGVETLVGIFSGEVTAEWLIFDRRIWVILPWPPVESEAIAFPDVTGSLPDLTDGTPDAMAFRVSGTLVDVAESVASISDSGLTWTHVSTIDGDAQRHGRKVRDDHVR